MIELIDGPTDDKRCAARRTVPDGGAVCRPRRVVRGEECLAPSGSEATPVSTVHENNNKTRRKREMSDGFTAQGMAVRTAVCGGRDAGSGDRRAAGETLSRRCTQIIAAEGLTGGGNAAAYPTDQSIRPTLTPNRSLACGPDRRGARHLCPATPPAATRSDQRIWDVSLEVVERLCPIDPANGVSTQMWGFRIAGETEVVCGSPGPGAARPRRRCREHHPDQPRQQHQPAQHRLPRSHRPGRGGRRPHRESRRDGGIQIRLLYPGVFMYHCAYGDVPVHISHGMYGAFIVDPEVALPAVDHEWVMTQSEWYVGEPDHLRCRALRQ